MTAFLVEHRHLMLSLPEREHLDIRAKLPHRSTVAGQAGSALILDLMAEVELAMQRLLAGHDAICLMVAQRRVARSIDDDGSRYLGWVNGRSTAELAILKHAAYSPLLDDRIKGMVYWRFTDEELLAIARLRGLALLYYDLTAIYRRLGKGQALRVAKAWPLRLVPADEGSRGLAELIERWETRMQNDPPSLAAVLGQHSDLSAANKSECILVAYWREASDQDPVTTGRYTLYGEDVGFTAGLHSPTVEFAENFAHLDESLRTRFDTSQSAIFDALRIFSLPSILSGSDRSKSLATLFRRGYILAPWPSESEILKSLRFLAPLEGKPPPDSVPADVTRAIALATLDPATISLQGRSPNAPIYRFGAAYMYDALAAGQFMTNLLRDLRARDPLQGQADLRLEDQAHAALSRIGAQPFVSGYKVRAAGKLVTDLDASVVRHGVLILADAYSSASSTALDLGEFSSTRNRAVNLLEKLEKWLQKANTIAQAGPTCTLDFAKHGITHVLPVVVTAAVEWVHDSSPKFWFDSKIPRALTVNELLGYIEPLDANALRSISTPVA